MNNNDNSPPEKKHHVKNQYPTIPSKYRYKYGIPSSLISIYHKQLYYFYKNLSSNKKVSPEDIHTIIREFFINYYYPFISKNLDTDKQTMAVIMGSVAFNMNIIDKNLKYLKFPTQDIDLKLYTTLLHYDKTKQDKQNVKKVMSVFKYILLVISMFMKQIIHETMTFFKTMFEETKPNYKKSTKDIKNNEQSGGFTNTKPELLEHKKKYNGILTRMAITLQIKNKNENEDISKNNIDEGSSKNAIDITTISYDDLFNTIMNKINTIDLLITTKIKYSIKTTTLKTMALTFTDSQIKYPSLLDNPTFYSYYLLDNKTILDTSKQVITLDKLYRSINNVNDIVKVNHCKDNYNSKCNYIALNSLKVDLVLMLQYAEFINTERYDETINIIVPIGALFKYYKYLTKYLKLYIIMKYSNKPLDKHYNNVIHNFIKYINTIIGNPKTNITPEDTIFNIEYKIKLNQVHQDLFINQSILKEHEELREAVDDYNHIKKYINKSRFLFKDEYEKYIANNKKCNMDYLNILRHIYTIPEYNPNSINPSMSGGMLSKTSQLIKYKPIPISKPKPCLKKQTIILYNDIDDEINDNFQSLYKESRLSVKSKHTKHSKMLNTYKKCKKSHHLKKSKKCKNLKLSKKVLSKKGSSKKGLSKKSKLQSKIQTKLDIDKLIMNRLKSDLHNEIESLKETLK